MNNTMKKLAKERKNAEKARRKVSQDIVVPEFDINGNVIGKKRHIRKWPFVVGFLTIFIVGSIYLPALNVEEVKKSTGNITGDDSIVTVVNQYLKNNPDLDFDNDGLSNEIEMKYGTSPYNSDSDNDRLCDYYEIFTSNTSPLSFDYNLQTLISEQDNLTGKNTTTPYKRNGVILWATDIYSKAYGSVVSNGYSYEFRNFKGWAQFPEKGTAYKIEGEYLIPLEYRENENAYKIEKACKVIVTQDDVGLTNRLTLFNNEINIGNNTVSSVLSTILPDRTNGFIKCIYAGIHKKPDNIICEIKSVDTEKITDKRFSVNENKMENLANVMAALKEGKCVLTSIYSEEKGEALAIIYGYTSDGEYLIADANTLKSIGSLTISFYTNNIVNKNSEIKQENRYEFEGLGYNSRNGSNIRFLGTSK